jgi:hypothetical protein
MNIANLLVAHQVSGVASVAIPLSENGVEHAVAVEWVADSPNSGPSDAEVVGKVEALHRHVINTFRA